MSRPSSSRSSRISSRTIPRSTSISPKRGAIVTSPSSASTAREVHGRHRDAHHPVVHVRRRVERGPQPLERERLIVGRSERARPAEEHVLEEVGDAVVLRGLEAGSDAQVERRHGRMHRGHRDEHDPEAVRELEIVADKHARGLLAVVVARGRRRRLAGVPALGLGHDPGVLHLARELRQEPLRVDDERVVRLRRAHRPEVELLVLLPLVLGGGGLLLELETR